MVKLIVETGSKANYREMGERRRRGGGEKEKTQMF